MNGSNGKTERVSDTSLVDQIEREALESWEVARILGVESETVRRMTRAGILKAISINPKRKLWLRSEINRYLKDRVAATEQAAKEKQNAESVFD
jgi:Helix-turn-helix domain